MSVRQTFKGIIELAFDYQGNREKIQSEKIIYIMIESDYENRVLPIIYVSMAVSGTLYSKIMKYKDSAKFYLSINKQNVNSNSSIAKNTLSGTFSYIPSTSNPNYSEDLNNPDDYTDSSYRRIMLGLVSTELTNQLRKSFNNVYNNIDQNTLVGLALEGTNVVIEPLEYNEKYDSILVPPITSRYKMLDFIFNKDSFYDTNYRYFMDFDKSYLLSKVGNPVDAGDGQLTNVIIDIRSVTANESYYEGIEVKNGAYYIYVNPSNTNITLNEGTEKVANQIVGVDDDGEVQTLDLDINNTVGSETKQMFVRSSNAALYKNELETNTIIIEILKQNIDGSAFTPNKCITINNYDDYKKYNGKYLIIYKKEFYKCVAGEFVVSCNVGLKKIKNIEVSRSKKSKSSSNSSLSPSASKRTSADQKNNLNSTNITSFT